MVSGPGTGMTRAVAAKLLAKTEHARLLARDLRRTRGRVEPARGGVNLSFPQSSNHAKEALTDEHSLWFGNYRQLPELQTPQR